MGIAIADIDVVFSKKTLRENDCCVNDSHDNSHKISLLSFSYVDLNSTNLAFTLIVVNPSI